MYYSDNKENILVTMWEKKKAAKWIQTHWTMSSYSAELNLGSNKDIIYILEQIWRQMYIFSNKYTKIKYLEGISKLLLSKITYLNSLKF